jgi:hypothetical protein
MDDDFNKSMVSLMQSDSSSKTQIMSQLKKLYKKYKTSNLSNYLHTDNEYEAIFKCDSYFLINKYY